MTPLEYPKIDTLFERRKEKPDIGRVIETAIRRSEFLIPREWLVTEKIHGCNIRVSLLQDCDDCKSNAKPGGMECDGDWRMQFDGRKANSQMPSLLVSYLQATFTLEGMMALWRGKVNCEKCAGAGWTGYSVDNSLERCDCYDPYPITLYGEGYGGGIQKGGGEYTSKTKGGAVSFRLFDVLVGTTWLRRTDVEEVASKLGIKCVPLIAYDADIDMIVEYVRTGIKSVVAHSEGTVGHKAEGIVAFTAEPLYNNRGQRLMFKLKSSDFA